MNNNTSGQHYTAGPEPIEQAEAAALNEAMAAFHEHVAPALARAHQAFVDACGPLQSLEEYCVDLGFRWSNDQPI